MLQGKTVVVGVCGGIAAYKMANCVSMLKKLHADVHVILTKNACQFIHPITFETLTGHKCLVDTFDRQFEFDVAHVSLGKKADVMLVAPATANVIGKMASGIADDMLTTTALAMRCRVLVAPAMNTAMYRHPIVQDNLKKLASFGFGIITPATGHLACGDEGEGKLPPEELLVDYVVQEIAHKNDLLGKKVMVSAGPTIEPMDPVRFISNHSTGKMGYEIAKAAARRGAEVTLVTGRTNLTPPHFVTTIPVQTAQEMFDVFSRLGAEQDIIIKAAAVADYRPKNVASEKMKKKDGDLTVELVRNPDIIQYLGEHRRPGQFLCGFSMETEHMLENSRAKLEKKHLDMIVANNLKQAGAGFGTDTNIVTLITKEGQENLAQMTKAQVADVIFDRILAQQGAMEEAQND